MTDGKSQTTIYQFDVAECDDNGRIIWLGDAWGESDTMPVFSCEGASLVEVLKMALGKLEDRADV